MKYLFRLGFLFLWMKFALKMKFSKLGTDLGINFDRLCGIILHENIHVFTL